MRLRLVITAALLLTHATWSRTDLALASNPESENRCDAYTRSVEAPLGLLGVSLGGPCGLQMPRRVSPTLAYLSPQPQLPPASELQLRIGVARPGGGHSVVNVPLEAYVARVLAGEAARDSQPAALEALAIAIRTYTLANRGRHRADGFDLCDETHCQVMRIATAATERAGAATAGRLLVVGGAPASIYYSASCGGQSEIPSEVWPGADDPPYLPSRPDDGCGGSPVWSTELSAAELLRAFRGAGFTGAQLREMRVASRNSSGRVARLILDGLTPAAISGQDLRAAVGRTLGWQFIKSTAFELRRTGDRYQFNGHGYGHGVGLCVIGSMNLALAGQSADDILHRYYPGLAIGTLKPPAAPGVDGARVVRGSGPGAAVAAMAAAGAASPVPAPVLDAARVARGNLSSPPLPVLAGTASELPTLPTAARTATVPSAPIAAPAMASASPPAVSDLLVSLPEGDERERGSITEVAARARTDIARALGVTPARIRLRFHPTLESYEQATREPWFTSGAFVNGEIHLLPPAVLRERGVLERTLRHELVHVMADAALAGRPEWVREGAAVYFSATPAISKEAETNPSFERSRTSCPADAELRRPVSVGALTTAYARAQSCFVRDLAKRRSWRDIK